MPACASAIFKTLSREMARRLLHVSVENVDNGLIYLNEGCNQTNPKMAKVLHLTLWQERPEYTHTFLTAEKVNSNIECVCVFRLVAFTFVKVSFGMRLRSPP